MSIQLSLACGDYEITRPIVEGRVQLEGIDLTVLTDDKERFFRLDRRRECDISELNILQYFRSRELSDEFVALPIFLHRRFRHSSIFVNEHAGIRTPEDLKGRKVGIGGVEPAAAIWIRGILNDDYGVGQDDVDWIDVFGRFGRIPDGWDQPLGFEDGRNRLRIDQMLVDGDLAATVSAYNPPTFGQQGSPVRRLFEDFLEVELDYYRRTKIFPIMHVLTVKRDVIERYPWAPASIAAGFAEAKRIATERLRDPRVMPLSIWQWALQLQREVMGPDPWRYGLDDSNRAAVQTAIRYCYEQGLTTTMPSVESLFVQTDDYSEFSKHPV